MSFKLIGDAYSTAGIEKWYIDEANYHNQFKGGRVQEYNLYADLENTNIFWNRFLQNGKFLDFGCAEGLMLQRFLKKEKLDLDYFGVEASEELLKTARNNMSEGRYYLAKNSLRLPFESNFFDYIAAISVLHHVANVSDILNGFKRILKPGGLLFLKDPITDMKKIDGSRCSLSPHERGIPIEYYLKICEKDFTVRRIQYLTEMLH